MGKSARDIMTGDAECVQETDSILDAAKALADRDVGAMPICGEDNRLKGMLTKVSELAEGKPVTIGADDSIEEALKTMSDHKVRRLPVIDGHDLIGIISQADIARNLDDEKTGDLVEAISAG
jgi:CBS domain-containing protein